METPAIPACKADAEFVCHFLNSTAEQEKWKGMNVVNIASVLDSRPRRRGAGRPGDFLRDLNTMLGRWESMTPSECTRVTGMYVALCRKTPHITDAKNILPSREVGAEWDVCVHVRLGPRSIGLLIRGVQYAESNA